jgi:glutathione S-transferase
LPGAPVEQAEVRRLVDWFQGKMQREVSAPLIDAQVIPLLKGTAQAAPDTNVLRAAHANLAYHMGYVAWLADQRNWLAGQELSLADLAAGAQISCLDYLGEIDWAAYPAAKSWYQRLKSRRSFQPLLADRVPGRPPAIHYAELDF